MEGLIGIGQATYHYESGGFYWTKTHTVLNGFDPTSVWDDNLANIIKVDTSVFYTSCLQICRHDY